VLLLYFHVLNCAVYSTEYLQMNPTGHFFGKAVESFGAPVAHAEY
jgi:hypothetical protein